MSKPQLIQLGENEMPDQVNNDRRRFLRNSAITIAAAEFALMSSAYALSGAQPLRKIAPLVRRRLSRAQTHHSAR
jgi:hypothetical protein